MSAPPSPPGSAATSVPVWRTDRMAQDLFLGIDLGTGGVRACVIDADAKIVGIATTALSAPRQDGDAIEQEPELWWNATVETLGKLGVDRNAIRRISVDGT